MSLPQLPTNALDDPGPASTNMRRRVVENLNELGRYPQEGAWAPVVMGSGTAGTYELAMDNCRFTRIGRRVFVDVGLQFAAAITGGGTSALSITGLPFEKSPDTFPVGAVVLDGVDWTAGANLSLAFSAISASSTLTIRETNDNAANAFLQIGAVAANDQIYGSISYETDDP
jgi:hypothetical protein